MAPSLPASHANGSLTIDSPSSNDAANGHVQNESPSPARPKPSSLAKKAKAQKYKHIYAIHSSSKASCLTYQDVESTPNFWGFKNLIVLMLVVSNLRLVIENFRKYGVLVSFRTWGVTSHDLWTGFWLYVSVPIHLWVAYLIECGAAWQAKKALGWIKKGESDVDDRRESQRQNFRTWWYLIALAHGINATLNLLITTIVVYRYIYHPGIGTVCELHAVIVWLKTCSYAFTNRDLRDMYLAPDGISSLPELYRSCPYPNNITFHNLLYYWWAPTLVYQPVYPKTERIRWDFVAKRLCEVIFLCIVIWLASAQYAAPLLQNSLDHIASLNVISIVERILKLSTISLFCWLAGFYALFQSFLNGLAEMMMFGDREFYSDWWNSTSIRVYWTSWNKPVYHFMKRHIYAPMVGRGVPPTLAQIIVFVFSGILHELLVGVPTHNILGVSFDRLSIYLIGRLISVLGVAMAGMLWQIPLIAITDSLLRWKTYGGRVIANSVFWITFCIVGQPLAVLLYFFSWQAKYGGLKGQADVK